MRGLISLPNSPLALLATASPPSVAAGGPSLAVFIDLMTGKTATPAIVAAPTGDGRQDDAAPGKSLPVKDKTLDATLAWLFGAPQLVPLPAEIVKAAPAASAAIPATGNSMQAVDAPVTPGIVPSIVTARPAPASADPSSEPRAVVAQTQETPAAAALAAVRADAPDSIAKIAVERPAATSPVPSVSRTGPAAAKDAARPTRVPLRADVPIKGADRAFLPAPNTNAPAPAKARAPLQTGAAIPTTATAPIYTNTTPVDRARLPFPDSAVSAMRSKAVPAVDVAVDLPLSPLPEQVIEAARPAAPGSAVAAPIRRLPPAPDQAASVAPVGIADITTRAPAPPVLALAAASPAPLRKAAAADRTWPPSNDVAIAAQPTPAIVAERADAAQPATAVSSWPNAPRDTPGTPVPVIPTVAKTPGIAATPLAVPAPIVPPAPVILPALFALAMRADRQPGDQDGSSAPSPISGALQPAAMTLAAIAQPADTQRQSLDMGQRDWPQKMIDRIEALRDTANANDTSIRLKPEALGRVDVALKAHADGAISVSFTAEQPATRTLIAGAAPQLVQAAEARGIRLSGTSVDLSGQGGDPRARPELERRQPVANHLDATSGGDSEIAADGRVA